jgi:hypothetical protein
LDQRWRGIKNARVLTTEITQRAQQGIRRIHLQCSVFSGSVTSGRTIAPGRLGNIISGMVCKTSSWLLGGKSSSDKNKLMLDGGIDCDATGEKERNPNPGLLVATGWGLEIISFARSAAEAPSVAWTGADDEELPAASERAATRSAVSAWVAILLFRRLIRKNLNANWFIPRWETRSSCVV